MTREKVERECVGFCFFVFVGGTGGGCGLWSGCIFEKERRLLEEILKLDILEEERNLLDEAGLN